MSKIKYKLEMTTLFKKDLKRAKKRGMDMQLLREIVLKLQCGESLPPKNKDHLLTSNWTGHRECHITPDWLLVYRVLDESLILSLIRTGSHSDLDF